MKWGFHPAAESEHLDHIAFYEARRTGLGARYLAAFESTLARVCEHPNRFRIEREPDIRRARLRQFPFDVIYRERSGTVQVLAISHFRRRPRYWITRA